MIPFWASVSLIGAVLVCVGVRGRLVSLGGLLLINGGIEWIDCYYFMGNGNEGLEVIFYYAVIID